LFDKLMQLEWLLRKNRFRGYTEGGHMADTTRGQGRILAVLKLRDGISTKDLSYLLGIQVSSMNELLAKMEKNGYVAREPSEQDKRVMLCKLTDKGRVEEQADAPEGADIFGCLTGDEQKTLGELLDKVIAALCANGDGNDEEWERRMESLRDRFGEFPGTPFGGSFRGHRGPGWPHGPGGPHGSDEPHGPGGPHSPGWPHGPHGPEGPRDSDRPYDTDGSHNPEDPRSPAYFDEEE